MFVLGPQIFQHVLLICLIGNPIGKASKSLEMLEQSDSGKSFTGDCRLCSSTRLLSSYGHHDKTRLKRSSVGSQSLHQKGNVLSYDFDKSIDGFGQDKNDEFDWTRRSGRTPSAGTGPNGDHTNRKGSYMYIESSFPRRHGDKARLVSPSLTEQGTAFCLRFYYHMMGEHIGDLSVLIIDRRAKQHKLWQIKGNVGDKWTQASVDLPPNTYQYVFEATTGHSYRGDIAIDDVSISKGSCRRKIVARVPPSTDIRKQCSAGPFGGNGTKTFTDMFLYKMYGFPNKVRLFYNDQAIYSIMFAYGGNFHASRGGGGPVSGGRFPMEKLSGDESISGVEIEYDTVVRRLVFFTNTTRRIGPFGGHGVFKKRIDGQRLLYISGTEDSKHVSSLTFHFDSGCKEVNLVKNIPGAMAPLYQTSKTGHLSDTYVHSIDRLSPHRVLNVEVAVFIDSEYADSFHRYFRRPRNTVALNKHVVNLLTQVQSWHQHPSLGYRLLYTIVKIVHLTTKQDEFDDFMGFCKYQSSFQSGGGNANGSDVQWDMTVYLSGKEGIFGLRFDGKPIEGRASLGGACNPTKMCAGAYHHFNKESYMVRLLAHEMAHTFGIQDDYLPPNNKRCRSGLMFNQHRGLAFSKCSVEDLKKWLLSEQSLCLDNSPKKTPESHYFADNKVLRALGSVDGSWGHWGSWSQCSRTCGGGVRRKKRECNSPSPIRRGRTCIGASYRNSMCNTRPCWNKDVSIFRKFAEECELKGFKRYAFPEIKGIYVEGTVRCQMMCTPIGKSFYRYYTVTNGFNCNSTQNDVCVDGVCVERGCDDGSFESKARFDKCGICKGDGSSCKVYSGTYKGQYWGRRHLLRIPRNAFNIRINIKPEQHRDMEGNVIHLSTVFGSFLTYLRRQSETHVITYAGVTWDYIYDKNGGWTPHILRTKGPIKKEVDIYLQRLWRAKPNLGVQYSYTLSKNHRRRTRIG